MASLVNTLTDWIDTGYKFFFTAGILVIVLIPIANSTFGTNIMTGLVTQQFGVYWTQRMLLGWGSVALGVVSYLGMRF